MDRLDRISIWTIVVLLIVSSVLVSMHIGEAGPEKKQLRVQVFNPVIQNEITNRATVVKNLMESANLDKAEMLVQEVIKKYPFEGEPRMLLGDIYLRRQKLVDAVYAYKDGVDLNPDYLDKKTPLFQGKKLKFIVAEALSEVNRELEQNPDNRKMKNDRKMIYYLQRRIAGSCG